MPEVIELPEKQLFSVFNITLLKTNHRLVKQLKACYQPDVHGDKTWFSSYLLMDYFQTHRIIKRSSRMLELGCGWGAAAIYCAKNGAKSVTGLDIDENVFPYLDVQAALNDVEVQKIVRPYEKLTKSHFNRFDTLFGADICFWDNLAELLFKLIEKAFANGVKRIVLADPGRQPFLDLADQCKSIAKVNLFEWYVSDPEYHEGYILDLKPKKSAH